MWMKGVFGEPKHTGDGCARLRARPAHHAAVWSDVVKEATRGDHTPVVSIGPALRHGSCSSARVDVLRRLVLVFFEKALVHTGALLADRRLPAPGTWPPQASRPCRRSSCAGEHPDPAALGHHRHLAPTRCRAADRNGAKIACCDHRAGRCCSPRSGVRVHHILTDHLFYPSRPTRRTSTPASMARPFHGHRLPRLPRDLGTIFLSVCLIRLLGGGFTRPSTSASRRRLVLALVDVVWLFCSPSSTSLRRRLGK